MKKFLVIGHFLKGTYTTDAISVGDLGGLKNGDCDYIIDTIEGKWFDAKNNKWEDIKVE